ncbi:hypothetical protein GGI15_002179 [Coemansia interrupta]|uniref:Uncharacterized protein n=1 Tax=Coemansia interrupta TaxID=1126814 RepID=A0A9W8HL38_9FUNG|nr:hypothetical protein GGI15_002179 [Coemansia interrupta]
MKYIATILRHHIRPIAQQPSVLQNHHVLPTRLFSTDMPRSTNRVVASIGGRRISAHEHDQASDVDDSVEFTYDEDPGISEAFHEKAIASEAAEAAKYGQLRVHPASPAKHTKIHELHGD